MTNLRDEATGTPAGQQMVSQLRAFHAPLRRDAASLKTALDKLSAAVIDVEQVDARIQGMTVADATWQLTSGCQWFCNGLGGHHGFEDARMLPVMAREFPELKIRIKKLRQQHEDVLLLLLAVIEASRQMDAGRPETITLTRDRVAQLAALLEAHLDLEEETLFPYFLRMDRDWHHG